MKQLMILAVGVMLVVPAIADTFGTGDNQFTIDFVPISGATNPESGYGIVEGDFRIGKYEITVNQWQKARFEGGYWSDEQPAASISWYQAAQFVNWLNREAGKQEAYNFDGGVFSVWDESAAAGGTNLYRHKDAFYFLPTENEWVKAAYWNGTNLQTYANKPGDFLHQGNGINGTGWNYWDGGYATDTLGPWAVGSGSQELNRTYDMMGNVWEWTESPYPTADYLFDSYRVFNGGSFGEDGSINGLSSSSDYYGPPDYPYVNVGFRVASVPEPASLALLFLGGLALRREQRR